MKDVTAENINVLAQFCGPRDIEALSADCLKKKYGIEKVDVMVLFGGSVLCGGDVLAQAMKAHIAEKYIIVGGEGHTTEALRKIVQEEFPAIHTCGQPEAEIFDAYIAAQYGLHADFLECESQNCGENVTYLLELIRQNQIRCRNIIICQDSSMQLRIAAGLRKYASPELTVINYAPYMAKIVEEHNRLAYDSNIHGMWSIEEYVKLLMGEISRLTDDKNGYGPNGKDFIAHVDVPGKVQSAFRELQKVYGASIR